MDKNYGPDKVVLGTYSSHAAAQHAVDVLASHKFPVEHVTIVGTGLRSKEIVLGRLTLGRVLVPGRSRAAGSACWSGWCS